MVVGTLNCSILVGTLKPRSGQDREQDRGQDGGKTGNKRDMKQDRGQVRHQARQGTRQGVRQRVRQVLYNGSVFFCRFCRIFGGSLESP